MFPDVKNIYCFFFFFFSGAAERAERNKGGVTIPIAREKLSKKVGKKIDLKSGVRERKLKYQKLVKRG